MTGYSIETPKGHETLPPDVWFVQHMLIVKTSKSHLQKSSDVLPYLTFTALLMAGLDYSIHRHVVYVAARPPRSVFRSIASHLNRKILYVPIGQLSPTKLKKLRVVHVLDSYARRAGANR